MFHRTWSLMFLRENVSAPCTVLDFPTRERFVSELHAADYDVVGISSIVVNVGKVAEMCRLIREHSPRSTIVVGGHVTSIPDIEQRIDADHIVRGEGIAWLRRLVGDDPEAPIRHPVIPSAFGMRVMGLRLVVGRDGTQPPGAGRALLRVVGLVVAIVPFFAGFLPILFDRRRRAIQDMLAGTVVRLDNADESG